MTWSINSGYTLIVIIFHLRVSVMLVPSTPVLLHPSLLWLNRQHLLLSSSSSSHHLSVSPHAGWGERFTQQNVCLFVNSKLPVPSTVLTPPAGCSRSSVWVMRVLLFPFPHLCVLIVSRTDECVTGLGHKLLTHQHFFFVCVGIYSVCLATGQSSRTPNEFVHFAEYKCESCVSGFHIPRFQRCADAEPKSCYIMLHRANQLSCYCYLPSAEGASVRRADHVPVIYLFYLYFSFPFFFFLLSFFSHFRFSMSRDPAGRRGARVELYAGEFDWAGSTEYVYVRHPGER